MFTILTAPAPFSKAHVAAEPEEVLEPGVLQAQPKIHP